MNTLCWRPIILFILTVQSGLAALSVTSLAPAPAATGICTDTPLSITFNEPPKVTSAGAIRIHDAKDPVTPVDVIDLSLGNLQSRTFPGDSQPFNVYSVLIRGNTAVIHPHAGVLTSNQTYFVTMDAGVFTDAGGTPFGGIADTNTWRFTTKPTGPADPANLVVAAEGSGDFRTVQGAVNSVSPGSTNPTTIHIRDGDYVEIVNISGKHNLLLRGESRAGTVIGYANNANIAPGGTTHARMAFKVNADDIAIDNLTLTNRTPQGGSQAEALMLETDIKRFIASNARIASYQDTILANTPGTQGYLTNCLVQGDVDFIWGGGNLFFADCEIRTLRVNADVTQPRQPAGSNGFSFVQCRFTRSSPAITGCRFTRTLGEVAFRFSSVAIIDCLIDAHITGWETDYLIGFGGQKNPNLRWWEHGNSNITATAPAVYQAHQIGVTNGDPRLELARNATNWLYGWAPQLSPNIVLQPPDQTAVPGQSLLLSVEATGIPVPAHQWRREGTNLVGETGASLVIPAAQIADSGAYSVVVSNASGTVTSRVATVTVTAPVSPTLSGPMLLGDGGFQVTFSGSTGQPYRVWAATNVALSPVTNTWTLLTNGVFGPGSEVFVDDAAGSYDRRFYLLSVP